MNSGVWINIDYIRVTLITTIDGGHLLNEERFYWILAIQCTHAVNIWKYFSDACDGVFSEYYLQQKKSDRESYTLPTYTRVDQIQDHRV